MLTQEKIELEKQLIEEWRTGEKAKIVKDYLQSMIAWARTDTYKAIECAASTEELVALRERLVMLTKLEDKFHSDIRNGEIAMFDLKEQL